MGLLWPIQKLLSVFPHASDANKAAILAMSFGAVMFIGIGLVGSVALPAWAVVTMFGTGNICIFATAGTLLLLDRKAGAAFRCRQVRIYPPEPSVREKIAAALKEIRQDAAEEIQIKHPEIPDEKIRANIFLLAQVHGGRADGTWKLVIHPDLELNMRHPPELQLQLSVGQGATGVAFRDGEYQLTRRQASADGDWPRKYQMSAEREAQIHKNLKWIVSFPLVRRDTENAVGVLNIDGLAEVADDEFLNAVASSIQAKIDVIADTLSIQPSSCIGMDQLGEFKHV